MTERILISRNGRLGDMAMIAPAIRELFSQFPEAEFTLITSKDGHQLYSNYNDRLKEIWTYYSTSFGRFVSRVKFRFKIKKIGFDRIYCFDLDNRYKKMVGRFTKEVIFIELDPSGSYELSALRAVGIEDPNLESVILPALPVSQKYIYDFENILGTGASGDRVFTIGLHPTFSGLNRTAARIIKLWSFENWALLAKRVSEMGEQEGIQIKIFIYLLPKDIELGLKIKNMCDAEIQILAPAASLDKYKAYLYGLDLIVAPDTGTAHLAACLGTNVISLFGYIPKSTKYWPKLTRITTRDETAGINAISVEEVFEECKKVILKSGNLV